MEDKKKIPWVGLEPTNLHILGQKYKNIFVLFLVQMKTVEFAFDINWPLVVAAHRRDLYSFRVLLGLQAWIARLLCLG